MEIILQISRIILGIIAFLAIYQTLIVLLGFLVPAKKFRPTDKKYKYCLIIAARNEEKVIAQLLHCIQEQDYPKELLTIVVAHNCTDQTAKIAHSEGVKRNI